ncbi:MAG: trypsin-like peptidase domain-containing protein [Candidatus Harrisonbacteria bacterium]|nr:trypsin-like peptidase domain-containing protein [Candidatus Harrisonbacteria bacterium]
MALPNIKSTIKKVMPAVVSIVISKTLQAIEKELPPELMGPLPFGENPMDIARENADERGMVKVGGGSGFIATQSGIILTNKHVVVDPHAEYTVLLNDGRSMIAKVLARDPIEDLAIIKIDAAGLPIVALGDSSTLELGEEILAIGNALGIFRNTVSAGIVSGLSRSIRAAAEPNSPVQELRGLIQTDAAINPGNSGGPLVNLKGEAVGINAAIVFGAQNLSFALPINAAKRDLHDLQVHGRIRRPYLGLRYVMIDATLKNKMGLPVDRGALILSHGPRDHAVIPGSPAHKAGIVEKDIILECGGKKLGEELTIQDLLETREVGDTVDFRILRSGKTIDATVTLAERKG